MVEVKVIEEPKIYLMGVMSPISPLRDLHCHHHFEDDHTQGYGERDSDEKGNVWAEDLVEYAGRLCYMSFDKRRPGGNKAYINHILESQHGSVLEHAVYSFILTGISRTLSHELERHRAGCSYSELSQRYVDLKDVAFVIPPEYIGNPAMTAVWRESIHTSLGYYKSLTEIVPEWTGTKDRKKVREAARSVLPGCTETKVAWTVNARALRHFFELRGSLHADAEIARLAVMLCKMMREYAPNLFGDYEVMCEADGREWIETKYRKV